MAKANMLMFAVLFPALIGFQMIGCTAQKMLSCVEKCEKEGLTYECGPEDCYTACRITEGLW